MPFNHANKPYRKALGTGKYSVGPFALYAYLGPTGIRTYTAYTHAALNRFPDCDHPHLVEFPVLGHSRRTFGFVRMDAVRRPCRQATGRLEKGDD